MKVLLDTHTFIWYSTGFTRPSEAAMRVIEDPANDVYVSIASFWEISIKLGLGKITLVGLDDLAQSCREEAFEILPVTIQHVRRIPSLPQHHRDPFDRMLVAQASAESLPIVSRDEALDAYGVKRIW